MVRGIREELGIGGVILLTESGTEEETVTSPSYPGLRSQYTKHLFRVTLSDEQFNMNGYIEEQEDKKTYFVWEEVKE